MRSEIARLEEKISRLEERIATKDDLAKLEERISRLEARIDSLIKWMISLPVTWATMLAALIAALKLLTQ